MVARYNETTDGYTYYGNVLRHQVVNKYYCYVKSILRQQRMGGANCLRHSDLSSDRMKSLLKIVIERKDLVRKVLYKEQLNSEF